MGSPPDSSTRKKKSENAQTQPRKSGKFDVKPLKPAKAPAVAKKAVAKPVAKKAGTSANPYELKSLKKTTGREGNGFTATLYFEGQKIADVADYGDGGALSVYYVSPEVRKEQEAALAIWHRANSVGDYSRALDSDDEQAINLLFDLHQRNKDSTKKIIFEIGPDISLMSDKEAKEYWQSGRSFSESDQLELTNATIADVKSLQFIQKKYPDARVWDASKQRYRPIADLLKV